jgi:5-methylcytosine-specific restriction endonuclease McrA
MNDRYRLGGLEDDQLLAALSGLVRRENDSLSDLLAHLAELDERALCLALGYSSLFAYCTEALGFCKSAAGRRIAAARVCRDFPEAFGRVANGELQLSVLCALRPHLNVDNASALFAACARKSCEQVEELLAARFPKPEVRDLIRRLPSTAVGTPYIGTNQIETEPTVTRQIELAPGAPSAGTLPTGPEFPLESPRPQAPRGAVKPLSADRFSVNFTADGEFRELLEEVRALLSHSEPKGDLMRVMKRGLEALRTELLKTRFGVGRKPRRVRSRTTEPQATSEAPAPQTASRFGTTEGVKRTRRVGAAVAREVYVRDQGRCTFCADDGRRCNERRLLQLDHVVPHAQGGEATMANLRLRCRAHNLHTAREYFGRECIRSALERTRKRARGVRFDRQRLDRPAPGQS